MNEQKQLTKEQEVDLAWESYRKSQKEEREANYELAERQLEDQLNLPKFDYSLTSECC